MTSDHLTPYRVRGETPGSIAVDITTHNNYQADGLGSVSTSRPTTDVEIAMDEHQALALCRAITRVNRYARKHDVKLEDELLDLRLLEMRDVIMMHLMDQGLEMSLETRPEEDERLGLKEEPPKELPGRQLRDAEDE